MATTGAPGNIPLFGDSDPVTPIQNPLNAIATATNQALTPTLVSVVPSTGFVDSSKVWKLNGYVFCAITAQSNTDVAAGTSVVIGNIPAGFRPVTTYAFAGSASYDTYPYPIVMSIAANGNITAFNGSSAQRTFAGFYAFPQAN